MNGNRISDWPTPGTYLLNLTKPEVADFMANYAYQVLLQSGLMYDGIFFDNLHTTIPRPYPDYNGVPHEIAANGDGQPDDPATLDAAWSAGLYRLVASFRKLVPYGLATGHLDSRPPQPAALAVFNGESLNGDVPKIREGLRGLRHAVADPRGLVQPGPGAWYRPGAVIAASPGRIWLWLCSQQCGAAGGSSVRPDFLPNTRFGLASALMTDGFSTYDFGDTSSLVNWWYDEYDFALGYPLGPAAGTSSGSSASLLTNPGI